MTTAFAALLAGIAAASLLVALIGYWWINRTPGLSERFDEDGTVPLFASTVGTDGVSLAGDQGPINATVQNSAAPATNGTAPAAPHQWSNGWVAAPTPPRGRPLPTASYSLPPLGAEGHFPNGYAVSAHPVTSNGVPGAMVEGHGLRYSIPAEGTLQFLPGRLEISAGLDRGREIRFVRVPGPQGTDVTFGRNEGPLYRHVQLRDQTVSREHAKLSFVDGGWCVTNLSRTNPVAHNGRVLGDDERETLEDGDQIEMGEVTFTFRSC